MQWLRDRYPLSDVVRIGIGDDPLSFDDELRIGEKGLDFREDRSDDFGWLLLGFWGFGIIWIFRGKFWDTAEQPTENARGNEKTGGAYKAIALFIVADSN